ncbi:hypothetical protein CK203_021901 [Vitis vinifera]|uniref:Uncharacterized protein n=1 Tax=Vitis vinifera TaxID=29760 RepID=A0A438JFN5_VITVI|nr:hypothetical protein CK203_021901 [Vitis vinifera]
MMCWLFSLLQPGLEGRNCIADEHYLPTFFHIIDPGGIANWSVTHVDWSEAKWHPKSYRAQDVNFELLKNITLVLSYAMKFDFDTLMAFFMQSIDVSVHVTSDERKERQVRPCLWNGMRRPCYLFARKFYPEAVDNLMFLFSNYPTI